MRPQRRGVPAGFHGYRAALTHPGFEAGEEALELAQSASKQIVNVASLRNARSKVGRRGIGIALDDRDLVEDVAQNAGGAHARQTAADHQSVSGGHVPPLPRPANLAAPTRRLSLQGLLAHEAKSSLPHRQEGTDLGGRRLDLNHNGVFDGLQSVEDSCGVPANIARAHDEFLRADRRFHFALHHVGKRFMRVGMKRGANSRRIVDLEERHLVTLDKRLDEQISAVHRLALDGAYRHSLDVSISRLDHVGLRVLLRQAALMPRGYFAQLAASIQGLPGASYPKSAFNLASRAARGSRQVRFGSMLSK